MEPWQVAALLGIDEKPEADDFAERMAAEKHTLAERAAKIRQMKGKDAPPETDDITDRVMREMGINLPS